MKIATVEDDDAVLDADKAHSNAEGCGYCCPHCLESSKHESVGSDREAVICDHCGETFVVWDSTEIIQCSGKLAS